MEIYKNIHNHIVILVNDTYFYVSPFINPDTLIEQHNCNIDGIILSDFVLRSMTFLEIYVYKEELADLLDKIIKRKKRD